MNTAAVRRLAQFLVYLVVFAALAKGLWMFFLLLSSEMNAAHHGWDGRIYTALGRGILNGLTPYADLFETKPPGMFLISALSLWLVGSIHLGNIFQGIAELIIVASLLLPVLSVTRAFSAAKKALFVSATLVFGCLLIAYTIQQSGHFQSESFGSAAIALYAAVTLITKRYRSVGYIAFSSLCFAFAIGVKEPFFLVALAVALLATRKPKELLLTYCLPLCIALVAGSVFMAVIGYLRPYLEIYLPEMLSGRAGYFHVPTWYYVFLVNKPLASLWEFSKPLAATIILLFLASIAFVASAWRAPRKVVALLLVITTFTILIIALGARVQYVSEHHGSIPSLLTFLVFAMCAYLGVTYVVLHRVLSGDEKADILRSCLIFLVSILLTTYVMGSGGFLRQHFGFPISLYAVFYMLFITYSVRSWSVAFHRWVFTMVAVLSSAGVLLLPTDTVASDLQQRIVEDEQQKELALRIDTIMDNCGYERYVLVGAPPFPYHHTKHSPIGPGFHRMEFISVVDWRPAPIPYMLDTFQENLRTVQLAISARDFPAKVPPELETYIRDNFTKVPPTCAEPFQEDSPVLLMYREVK